MTDFILQHYETDKGPEPVLELVEALAPEPVPTATPAIDYRLHAQRWFLTRAEHLGGEQGVALKLGDREEAIVLVLTGRVAAGARTGLQNISAEIGARGDLFSGHPEALVLAPGSYVELTPVTDAAEIVIATTGVPEDHATRTAVIREADLRVHAVGEAHYARTVYEIVGETQHVTTRLCCGETEQAPGVWSSWPHHEFDEHPELATQFDEVFYVFAKPLLPTIKGAETILRRRGLMVDGTAVDDVLALPNGAEARVPLGHHPICAPLEARLRYVWFYAGPPELKKRYAKRAKDNGYYA